MIPDTIVGLILVAASVGPGYVWIRVSERRVARSRRSALLEATELVVIGSIATTVSALIILSIPGWIDRSSLRQEDADYLLAQPRSGLTGLLAVFALAYVGTGAAALLVHRGRLPSHTTGTVWLQTLGQAPDRFAYATVELRDGRTLSGRIDSFTLDPPAHPRELALSSPLLLTTPKAPNPVAVEADHVILNEADLLYIAVRFHKANRDQS